MTMRDGAGESGAVAGGPPAEMTGTTVARTVEGRPLTMRGCGGEVAGEPPERRVAARPGNGS